MEEEDVHFFGEAVDVTTEDDGEVKASVVDDSRARRIAVVVYLIIAVSVLLIAVLALLLCCFRLGLDLQSAACELELLHQNLAREGR